MIMFFTRDLLMRVFLGFGDKGMNIPLTFCFRIVLVDPGPITSIHFPKKYPKIGMVSQGTQPFFDGGQNAPAFG